jgi:prophage tail gpP-like protein
MSENLQIYIADREVRQFSGFSMVKSLDSVGDGFAFTCPFFPDTREYRGLFRPFSYHKAMIDIGGARQFTGRIESVGPQLSGSTTSVSVSGRSLAGSIVDSTFLQSVFPVQFSRNNLREITQAVLSGFDFGAVFDGDPGALFEEAGPTSPSETVFSFLHNLAKQRKFLMSQTPQGDLLYRRAKTSGSVVAVLEEGQHGLTISGAMYDGSQRHSRYDVFGQEPGENANFATVSDPAISGAYRPKSAQANDTNAGNIADAAAWMLTADIAAAIDIPLELEGWRRPDGQLWAENELIVLTAPSLMVYRPSMLLIKSVTFKQSDTADTVAMSLTIPGAYSGEVPGRYPWDE